MSRRAHAAPGYIDAGAHRSTQTEKQFQRTVETAFRQWGWLVVHFPFMQGNAAGFPDLLAWGPHGEFLVAELKAESGKLSPHQEAWQQALTHRGARYYLWRPSDWDTIEHIIRTGDDPAPDEGDNRP